MTRGEIWKDFFKRTVLPAVIALFLFFMCKNVFTEDGQTNYFYVWLCCGIPFGIRRMFVWLVPHGYDIAGTTPTGTACFKDNPTDRSRGRTLVRPASAQRVEKVFSPR